LTATPDGHHAAVNLGHRHRNPFRFTGTLLHWRHLGLCWRTGTGWCGIAPRWPGFPFASCWRWWLVWLGSQSTTWSGRAFDARAPNGGPSNSAVAVNLITSWCRNPSYSLAISLPQRWT